MFCAHLAEVDAWLSCLGNLLQALEVDLHEGNGLVDVRPQLLVELLAEVGRLLEALSGEVRGLLEALVRQHSCSLKGIDPGDEQVEQVSVVLNCSGDIGLERLVACLKTLKSINIIIIK